MPEWQWQCLWCTERDKIVAVMYHNVTSDAGRFTHKYALWKDAVVLGYEHGDPVYIKH